MEREISTPDNSAACHLNRQAELLWGLTVEIQRRGEGMDPITRGLRLICMGAYRYMMKNGRQDWANEILRIAQISHPTSLQNIQGPKVTDAAY